MNNSRAFRRRLAVNRKAISKRRRAAAVEQRRKAAGRWPFGGPSMSSVRRWMKQLEAAGRIERCGVERTGKPGRPAQLWQATARAKEQPLSDLPVGDPEEIRELSVGDKFEDLSDQWSWFKICGIQAASKEGSP